MSSRRWSRYVAIGDSTTEGMDDPDGQGGYRGWADRLADRLAEVQGGIEYANLAIRGRVAEQIRNEQLEPALALRPDLASVVAGMNDLLRPGFDARAVAGAIETMQAALIAQGAVVVTFTLPELGRVMHLARPLRGRVHALNDAIRAASQRSGALLLDLAVYQWSCDPRLWSDDRLHPNTLGHERVAAAICHLLDVPGSDASWRNSLDPAPPRAPQDVLAAEWAWTRRHLGPWALRRIRGRSAGDGVVAKRPDALPVDPFREMR